MPTFAEVRAKYPQYKDMSDQQLAEGLHKKFYADMPFDQFAEKVGYQAQQPFPDVYAGAGGFNPMLARLGGGALAGGQALGMTPENMGNNELAPAEVAMQMGSGAVATPLAGLAGIGQGVKNIFSPGMPAADRVRQVQEALTYQPRTGAGAAMSRIVGAPGEAWQSATNKAGEVVADKTDLPSLGALVKTAGDIAPGVAGARLVGVERPTAKPKGNYVSTKNDIPTTEQLRSATNAAYKRGEESGVMVKADKYANAADEIAANAKSEGLDPVLHPKSARIVQVLQERKGNDLNLQEAENLRRIALEAEGDVNNVGAQTGDGRIAGTIVDALDEKIDALATNAEARALNRRKANSQLLDSLQERAQIKAGANYTQSGLENALRKEYQALALNARRMKRLTPDQQQAIKRVAMGGPLENTMRNLGKFDPTTGGMAAALSAGLGGGFAPATGGASLLLPGLGYLGKRGATMLTKSNVEAAREALVGRGINANPIAKGNPTPLISGAIEKPVSNAARSPANIRADMGKLLQRASNIPANIARDSPQVKALWAEMERLQAELTLAESSAANAPGPVGPPRK